MTHKVTRRDALVLGLHAAGATWLAESASADVRKNDADNAAAVPSAAKGIEGQHRADLGNGTFMNPVLAGDHPDPSVLKDGASYYKVSSSFDYYPGLVLWESKDLVNWSPLGPTLRKIVGTVLAPDLVKHGGRYFIYFAVTNLDLRDLRGPQPYADLPMIGNYVIHADSIDGPWSDPIDLRVTVIDPGHAVGEDGKRYLFLADGRRIRLNDDGLKTDGKLEKVYEGWPIPEDWVIEGMALESPKVLRHRGWFYMFSAQGGTAGPPTSHMVVVARSRSIHGPWENCPHNPIVRTASSAEPWWSRGHATAVEGPNGDWWIVYHGYQNGRRTLGRQMLLEPIEWTADGWPRATGGDLSRPLRKPDKNSRPSGGTPRSDDFKNDHLGTRLAVFMPKTDYLSNARLDDGRLQLSAFGSTPADSNLLVMNVGESSYHTTFDIALSPGAAAGLLLFYNKHAFCGIAASASKVSMYKAAMDFPFFPAGPAIGPKLSMRVTNDRNVASFAISADGARWRKVISFEVSGYNHNVFDGFLSLRPGICAMGQGSVTLLSVEHRAAS